MPAVAMRHAAQQHHHHLAPVLRQDTFWSPQQPPIAPRRSSSRSPMMIDSEDEEEEGCGADSPVLGTPQEGHSPALDSSFSFSPYLSAYSEEEEEHEHAAHAFDHASAVDQKRRSTYLPAVLLMNQQQQPAAMPNYARPIRTPAVIGSGAAASMFGTSAQRSRRQQQRKASLGGGLPSPSPSAAAPRSPLAETTASMVPSPTFSASTYDEAMPVTPPAPTLSAATSPAVVAPTSPSPAAAAEGRRSRTLMSKTLYSLKNASTASFAAVGGPLRGLGMSMDTGSQIDISSDLDEATPASVGRSRKSSLTRPFSTLFGIKRKKVPSFDMIARPITLTRPTSIQSHTAAVVSAYDHDHEEMLIDGGAESSGDEFSSYARTVYELDAGARSTETLRGAAAQADDEREVAMPAVTLEELAHIRASLDVLYRQARGPSSASSSSSSGSRAGSLRSIRRKPVPALINSSPVIPPRSASIEQEAKQQRAALPTRHLIRRKTPPSILLRPRTGSTSSGSDMSDSAPTLTPTLHSAKSSHSSSSSSSSLDSYPSTPMSMIGRAGSGGGGSGQYELDVASILNPDDEMSSRPLSGIGLEELLDDTHVVTAKKSRSWADRLMRQKSKRQISSPEVLA